MKVTMVTALNTISQVQPHLNLPRNGDLFVPSGTGVSVRAGRQLYGVRLPDEEVSRWFQRGPLHRLHDVHDVRPVACLHYALLSQQQLCHPHRYTGHVPLHQVPSSTPSIFSHFFLIVFNDLRMFRSEVKRWTGVSCYDSV